MAKKELSIGLVFLCVAAAFYAMTLDMPARQVSYPRMVTGLLALISLLQIGASLRAKDTGNSVFEGFMAKQFFTMLGLAAVYIYLINIVGFFGSTALYLVAQMAALKVDRKTMAITTEIGRAHV